jgi:hypothetical protein
MKKKNKVPLPEGRTEARVNEVADYYDNLSDADEAAEDDAVFAARDCTVMVIPKRLVNIVRELIAIASPPTRRRTTAA